MKQYICIIAGIIGSAAIHLLGGWDLTLQALILFMAIDYITGLLVAGIFKRSNKTENGALESMAGWKGLCKKIVTLFVILVANYLDLLLEVNCIRTAAALGFVVNEAISILENAGRMGIPIGTHLTNALELLKNRSDQTGIK